MEARVLFLCHALSLLCFLVAVCSARTTVLQPPSASMSARLNDDVLLLILDELANQGKGAHARPSRSGILASVCLVSRRFSRLARPRLWQHVEVSQGGQLAGLKATTGALGSCAVSYTVRWSWTANAVLADLVDVARWLPCVLDLRIHGCWTQLPSLSSIESHTCLRRLTLVGFKLPGPSGSPVVLPHLEQLSIYNVSVPASFPSQWLQPPNLPRLRALRLIGFGDASSRDVFPLPDILSPSLLAQLDFVQTDACALAPDEALARGSAPPFIFEVGAYERAAPRTLPRHTLLQSRSDLSGTLGLVCPDPLAAPVSARDGPPQDRFVVVFPKGVKPSVLDPSLQSAIEAHKASIKKLGGRVIECEEGPSEEEADALSLGFWRYARELKAARTAGVRERL